MIIGFDASRAFTHKRTGTEEYSSQLLRHLAKIDRKNNYIVYMRPLDDLESVVNGLEWPHNFQFKTLNFPFLWTQIGLSLQTFIDKLDILLVPSHTLPLIVRPGLKTIMTIHDLGAEYLPGLHQLKQALYLKFITFFQLKSATHLIAVSKATKEDLVKKVGIEPSRMTVIYEGYSNKEDAITSFQHDTGSVLRKFGLEKGNYFLFVGTIQPRKNLGRLIEAFGRYCSRSEATRTRKKNSSRPPMAVSNNIKLVLVGKKGWKSEQIYELPKKLGIEGRVKFLGYISEEEKTILYQNAIALLFPSLFEGFGLPILEAFANDCPVLTSNISSMPEVSGPVPDGTGAGAAILVDPYDIESIKEGLLRIENGELRMKLIEAGKRQLKKFSWEKCARETLKVLGSIY